MRLVKPTPAPVAPAAPRVDAAANAAADTITITLTLPRKKTLTEAQLNEAQREAGKDALAICDLTGAAIFKDKNVNEIHNDARPEFDGKVVSTVVLKALFDAVAAANR